MKAIVYHRYGSAANLHLTEVETPVPVGNEVLVKVFGASVNEVDWRFLTASPFPIRLQAGLFRPKNEVLGLDISGRVEQVGPDAVSTRVGDEVYGQTYDRGFGAFAEYACASEEAFGLKPRNLSFEQAAAVPVAATTALQGLRDKGQIRRGQSVLINGASGGVGSFAVQIAKLFGTEVTGVCSSNNIDLVRTIGADKAIDYTREDFTLTNMKYDLVLDAVGNRSATELRRVLSDDGVCVVVGISSLAKMLGVMFFGGKRVRRFGNTREDRKDLLFLREQIESGKISPVIDRQYDLDDIPEAIRYVETKRAKGKVTIRISR